MKGNDNMNKKLQGTLILMITAIVWGLSFVSQSVSMDHIGPNTFNGIRTLLGCVSLLPVIAVIDRTKKKKGEPVMTNKKDLITGGILCGILLCAASTIQTYGLKYTTAGKAGFITTMYMIIVPAISFFLGKKIRPVVVLSIIVAMFGMYFLCIKKGTFVIEIGDIYIFICAIIYAFHIMVIDCFSPKVDGVKLSCMQFLVGGSINIILMFAIETPVLSDILACTGAILYAGIMTCGVAYTLQIIGQKYAEPTVASIVLSMESVFAVLAGWLILSEAMTSREIFGCILAFIATILVQMPDKKRGRPQT